LIRSNSSESARSADLPLRKRKRSFDNSELSQIAVGDESSVPYGLDGRFLGLNGSN
jgi:hypothetical protein